LQSLAPTPVSRGVDVRQAAVVKIIAESLSQHDEKHVVPTPLSGIRVGRRRLYVYNVFDIPYQAETMLKGANKSCIEVRN
jgi:hypothetical protein